MKIFPTKTFLLPAVALGGCALAGQRTWAAGTATNSLPPAAQVQIQFDRDIRPILATSCWKCHGPQKPRSHFSLADRTSALAGGEENPDDIVPGNSTQSWLVSYVARRVPDMEMPPEGKGNPLTPQQISLLRAWIDQGASWNTTNRAPALSFTLAPTLRWIDVHGNPGKFRELEGTTAGFSEGVDAFSLTRQLSPDEHLSLTGHALVPEQNFDFKLTLDKTDRGFIDAGFDQWRKYYNDFGGFDPKVIPSGFNPGRDLHLDDGRAWIDFGLDLPRWPLIVLGYEYQYRQGTEATLAWGPASGRHIYPATRAVDEQTHIIKLKVMKTLDDWRLEDNARVEFYTEKDTDGEAGILFGGAAPDNFTTTRDNYRQVQGMNTVTMEKQIRDWWYFNSGFYYSDLSGSDYFNQTTAIPAFNFNSILSSQQVTLSRKSDIFSLASLFTPLSYLSLSLGAQNEWSDERGFSESIPDLELGGNVPVNSSLDEFKGSQTANFRFTKIPFTVVFGDASTSENNYSIYQAENPDELFRETVANNFRYDLKPGFSTSPWRWLDLTVQYERKSSATDYNPQTDVFNGLNGPTNGYPAFIRERTILSDQFETKLVLYPAAWLKTTLSYQLTATDYSSRTDPARVNGNAMEVISGGGALADGLYHLQTVGFSATVTPFQKFYFSAAFTYSHSRVETADNGTGSILPYEGDIYTLTASATYALNQKTGLQLADNFSHAGYADNQPAMGIPTGLDYTRNDLIAGVTRQLTKRLSSALHYEFSQYAEPSTGNVNNFTAHGIFLTLAYAWP